VTRRWWAWVGAALAGDAVIVAALSVAAVQHWAWRIAWQDWAGLAGWGVTVAALALAVGVGGWLADRRDVALAGRWMLGTVLLSGFWSQAIKHLVGRPRPRLFLAEGCWAPTGPSVAGSWDSFPSGHAMTVFAVVPLLEALAPRAGATWRGLAWLVALGRVAGGDHYLSDVLVGALLGLRLGRYARDRWAAEVAHAAG
jgi:undecaprenyl-diphosphatase